MSALAFTLIGVILARSPYTHHNLEPEGYDRTELGSLDETPPFDTLHLADGNECASCHGLNARGALVGGELDIDEFADLLKDVRRGPKGMPSFVEEVLSDEDVEDLFAFLESVAAESSDAQTDEVSAR
jgi:cytochrome c553